MIERSTKIIALLLAVFLLLAIVGCTGENEYANEETPAAAPDPVINEEQNEVEEDPPLAEREEQPVNVQPPLTEPEPAPDGTILTIYGDGVESQTDWTLEDLINLEDGYLEITYSTTRNWPTYSHMTGHGVSLIHLLEHAGLLDTAKTFVFSASDGYRMNITREQIYETRFTYSEHTMEKSSGAVEAEPMIAWEWGDVGDVSPGEIRPMFGQKGPQDVNTAASVRNLYRIEVLSWDIGSWEAPGTSIPSGSTIPAGTELELTHPQMDNVGIYYTLDKSDPNYDSTLYNISTSYFQPELIVPIIIEQDLTIKVFAGGLGKKDSEIATFIYTVG